MMKTFGRRHQSGIALIEALVGMLIFAFGVLGLVGLQASMTQAQTSARYRAEAANLASELFGLIESDHISRLSQYSDASCAGYPRCADWQRKLEAQLPAATFALVNAGGGPVSLTISWSQGGESANSYSSAMVWQQ